MPLFLINCICPEKVLQADFIDTYRLSQHYLSICLMHITVINFPLLYSKSNILICVNFGAVFLPLKDVSPNIVAKPG